MQETLKANPYVYADNDPVNEVDPSGESGTLTGAACAVGVALAALANGGAAVGGAAIIAAGGLKLAGFKSGAAILSFLAGFLPKVIANAVVPVLGWVVLGLSIAYMAYQGFLFWDSDCAH